MMNIKKVLACTMAVTMMPAVAQTATIKMPSNEVGGIYIWTVGPVGQDNITGTRWVEVDPYKYSLEEGDGTVYKISKATSSNKKVAKVTYTKGESDFTINYGTPEKPLLPV